MRPERWDWADVAAVGVMARHYGAPPATLVAQLDDVDDWATHEEHKAVAAAVRYGWAEWMRAVDHGCRRELGKPWGLRGRL